MHPYDAYDPWDHAHALGYDIIRGPVSRPDHNAETHTDLALIVVAPDQSWRDERCAVAHEIPHIEHGDMPIPEGIELRKRELRCDRIAAERLVNPDRLARAIIDHPDPATWCLDLDITARILRTYLHQHPSVALEARIRRLLRLGGERERVTR